MSNYQRVTINPKPNYCSNGICCILQGAAGDPRRASCSWQTSCTNPRRTQRSDLGVFSGFKETNMGKHGVSCKDRGLWGITLCLFPSCSLQILILFLIVLMSLTCFEVDCLGLSIYHLLIKGWLQNKRLSIAVFRVVWGNPDHPHHLPMQLSI